MSEQISEERLDQIRRDAASSAVHPSRDEVVALVDEIQRHRSRAAAEKTAYAAPEHPSAREEEEREEERAAEQDERDELVDQPLIAEPESGT